MFSTIRLWQLQPKLHDTDPRVRDEAVAAIATLGTPAAARVLADFLRDSTDPPTIHVVAHALGGMGLAESIDGLSEALDGPARVGAAHIVQVLSGMPDPHAIPGLLKALQLPIPWDAVSIARAIDYLKRHADKTVRAGLCDALTHNLPQVCWHIINALGELREVEAIDRLLAFLGDETLGAVAAHALERIHHPRAVAGLVATLRNRPLPPRQAALAALESLGWRPTNQEEAIAKALVECKYRDVARLGPAALTHLLPELALGDPASLIPVLAELSDPRIVPELVHFWQQHRQCTVEVCRAIGALRDPQGTGVLVHVLADAKHDPEGICRTAAAWAAGEIGDPRLSTPLIQSLHAHDDKVVAAAATALGKRREKSAVAALIECLAHPPCADTTHCAQVRRAAAEALGRIEDPHAIKPLIRALRHEAWIEECSHGAGHLHDKPMRRLRSGAHAEEVNRAIATALAHLHHPQTAEAVAPLFTGELATPWGVLDVLDALGDDKSLELLRQIMAGEHGHLRCRAAQALAHRHDPAGLQFLLTALRPIADDWSEGRSSASPEVEYAARYLGELHEPAAVRPLLTAMQELSDPARNTLRHALRQILAHAAAQLDNDTLATIEAQLEGDDDLLVDLVHAEQKRRAAGHADAAPASPEIAVDCVCGKHYRVKRLYAGKRMKCGHCGHHVVVPTP